MELEQKESFAGENPVFQQQTEQLMKINGECLEQESESSHLVQEEIELEIVSSEAVQQETELETDTSELVEQEMHQETHLNGLDQRIESSELENTKLSRESQEPKMDILSVESSTTPAAAPPSKTPVKVRVAKTDMCVKLDMENGLVYVIVALYVYNYTLC